MHENILDHDVDVSTLSLDQELVDSRKDRKKDLDLKNEVTQQQKMTPQQGSPICS